MPMARPPAPANNSTLRIEKPPYGSFKLFRVLQLAFPDRQHFPAFLGEKFLVARVALLVGLKLRLPEIEPGFRHARERALLVAVPEAAMHENDLAAATEYQIRAARQFPVVEPVAIAFREDKMSDQHFRPGIFRADARHDFGALGGRDIVHTITLLRPARIAAIFPRDTPGRFAPASC